MFIGVYFVLKIVAVLTLCGLPGYILVKLLEKEGY